MAPWPVSSEQHPNPALALLVRGGHARPGQTGLAWGSDGANCLLKPQSSTRKGHQMTMPDGVTDATVREIAEQTLRRAAEDLARDGETPTTHRAVAGWLHQRAASLGSEPEHGPTVASPRPERR